MPEVGAITVAARKPGRVTIDPTSNDVSLGSTQVTGAVATWSASGGSDGAEGQFFALHALAVDPAIGWRPGARRIVVWFGDYPGHDPICTASPAW